MQTSRKKYGSYGWPLDGKSERGMFSSVNLATWACFCFIGQWMSKFIVYWATVDTSKTRQNFQCKCENRIYHCWFLWSNSDWLIELGFIKLKQLLSDAFSLLSRRQSPEVKLTVSDRCKKKTNQSFLYSMLYPKVNLFVDWEVSVKVTRAVYNKVIVYTKRLQNTAL